MRRWLAVSVSLLFGFVAAIAVGTPAWSYLGCLTTQICLFDGFNGGTKIGTIDQADRPGCFELPAAIRNRTSSIDNINTVSHQLRVYNLGFTCSGSSTLVFANTEGNMGGQWNNSIDSLWIY